MGQTESAYSKKLISSENIAIVRELCHGLFRLKSYEMKLLIATYNKGKLQEISAGLADVPLEILSLHDMDVNDADFVETGDSFRANSLLKANFYFNLTGLPTIADDSGLAVDALNGEPGIKSRRWPGHDATDDELMSMMLERLRDIPSDKRTAHFICALSFVNDPEHQYTTEHRTLGHVLNEPVLPVQQGVPWSSLFFADEVGKVYSQLTMQEKNKISHRGKALQKIKPFIIKHSYYAGQ